MTITETHFSTQLAAQAFANLRSMVDGYTVEGPYMDGTQWVVYSVNPSTRATASLDTLAFHHVNAYGDIWCPVLGIATPDTNHGVCTAC